MKIYFKYLLYVIRHKWYVLIEAYKMGILFRGILHDISKFMPDEFIAYAKYFYHENGCKFNGGAAWQFTENSKINKDFDKAWLKHIHRNPHHWQYWILRLDDGGTVELDMPIKIILEMVADWRGAGKAITGADNTEQWYLANKSKMQLSKKTRSMVEDLIVRKPLKEHNNCVFFKSVNQHCLKHNEFICYPTEGHCSDYELNKEA